MLSITAARMARSTFESQPETVLKFNFKEMSDYTEEEMKAEAADIIADPKRMETLKIVM